VNPLRWTRKYPQVVAHQGGIDLYAGGATRCYLITRTPGGGMLDACTLDGGCTGLIAYARSVAALKREAALWERLTDAEIQARQANGVRNVSHPHYGL
jgi:hypothetical protein